MLVWVERSGFICGLMSESNVNREDDLVVLVFDGLDGLVELKVSGFGALASLYIDLN